MGTRYCSEPRSIISAWASILLAVAVCACGGGGGTEPGGNSSFTLHVLPDSNEINVGDTAQFSVIATDSNGQVIATPALTWSSELSPIATVASDGVATGLLEGQTLITAKAGNVVSSPGVLTVTGPCDGVGLVNQWDIAVAGSYTARGTAAGGAEVIVHDFAFDSATMTRVGAYQWTGEMTGRGGVDEKSTDNSSDPPTVATLLGTGPNLPTEGVTGITFTIDPATCTFKFTAAPSVLATAASNITPSATGVFPIAVMYKGSQPLGPWRDTTIIEANIRWPVYSVVANLTGGDGYVPYGAIAQLFIGFGSAPVGTATVAFDLHPHGTDLPEPVTPSAGKARDIRRIVRGF